jgi:NAD(P)H-hydrate epimerase
MKVQMEVPRVTVAQMREVDRLMIDEYHISLEQMMENAGRSLAEMARRMLGGTVGGRSVAVLCGIGNNGGGGMAAARHLHNWGAQVDVNLVGEAASLRDAPLHQWQIAEKLGLGRREGDLQGRDLYIDALLGYGGRGNPRTPISEVIELINGEDSQVLALDVPSGLDASTGVAGSPCVRATTTLTLALPKLGLVSESAEPFVGNLYLADIGIPPELYAEMGIAADGLFANGPLARIRGSDHD